MLAAPGSGASVWANGKPVSGGFAGLVLPFRATAALDLVGCKAVGDELEIFEASVQRGKAPEIIQIGTDQEGDYMNVAETEKGTAGIPRRVGIPAAAALKSVMQKHGTLSCWNSNAFSFGMFWGHIRVCMIHLYIYIYILHALHIIFSPSRHDYEHDSSCFTVSCKIRQLAANNRANPPTSLETAKLWVLFASESSNPRISGPKEMLLGLSRPTEMEGTMPSRWALFNWVGVSKSGAATLAGGDPVTEGLMPKGALQSCQCFQALWNDRNDKRATLTSH